jgi:type I restriction enzyme, R subunit
MIKEVMEKMKLEKPLLAPDYVWNAYAAIEEVKSKQPKDELTALVSLIRRACGIDKELNAFDSTIETNFNKWIFIQHTGQHNRFTAEQLDWLRLIKGHVVSSYHIEVEDSDYTPFDSLGGRGKMHKLFGDQMIEIINELNEVLAA